MNLDLDELMPLIIYHANCIDGFTAAFAAYQRYEDRAEYVPMNYGAKYEGSLKGRDVFILDFSFPRDVIVEMASVANSVTVLDHHKTAKEALSDWQDKPTNVYITFDMNKSGAALAWGYFVSHRLPPLIQYVQDRDLWKWEFYRSKEVSAYIANTNRTFSEWGHLHLELQDNLADAIYIGTQILKYQRSVQEAIVGMGKRKITIDGEIGLVCNCPPMFASEVGEALALESGTYGATYYHDSNDSVLFSLRSRNDFDVSALAKIFGGGGHKNAAGFKLDSPIEYDGATLWSPKGEISYGR